MNIIEIEFEYTVPDYLDVENTDKHYSASITYKGPKGFYVQVDENNKCLDEDLIYDEEDDNFENILENWADGNSYVFVDAQKHPFFAYLVYTETFYTDEESQALENKRQTGPQFEYFVEGDTEPFYSHPKNLQPETAYLIETARYDADKDEWLVDLNYLDNRSTEDFEEDLEDNTRRVNELIESAEENDLSEDDIQQLKDYLKEFENIPTKYGDYPPVVWPRPHYPLDKGDEEDPAEEQDEEADEEPVEEDDTTEE